MAAENGLRFDDNFVDLPGVGEASQLPTVLPTIPTNPLYHLIDSDRYIQSLENKLKKLKGGKQKEPTAKEMIKSLTVSKEAHFRHVDDDRDSYCSNFVPGSSDMDKSYSVLQRKMFPDRVAIDPEELVELLHDNDVEKQVEAISDPVLSKPPNPVSNTLTTGSSKQTTCATNSHVLPTCTLSDSKTGSGTNSLTSDVKSSSCNLKPSEEKEGPTETSNNPIKSE